MNWKIVKELQTRITCFLSLLSSLPTSIKLEIILLFIQISQSRQPFFYISVKWLDYIHGGLILFAFKKRGTIISLLIKQFFISTEFIIYGNRLIYIFKCKKKNKNKMQFIPVILFFLLDIWLYQHVTQTILFRVFFLQKNVH